MLIQDLVEFTDRNRLVIVSLSTVLCGIVYTILLKGFGATRRTSSEIASIFHHMVVIVLSICCMYENMDHLLHDSVLTASTRFPLVNTIQWINIGYFIYDSVHAIAWEHNFVIHHAVALSGFIVSDVEGLGGLGNAVNTLIAEIGSVMYNVYNKNKSLRNYLFFVVTYTITRVVFVGWTYWVFIQLYNGYNSIGYAHCQRFIVFVFLFQALLVIVNIQFLSVHLRKAYRVTRSHVESKKQQ